MRVFCWVFWCVLPKKPGGFLWVLPGCLNPVCRHTVINMLMRRNCEPIVLFVLRDCNAHARTFAVDALVSGRQLLSSECSLLHSVHMFLIDIYACMQNWLMKWSKILQYVCMKSWWECGILSVCHWLDVDDSQFCWWAAAVMLLYWLSH